jgi:small subunit ribosomal protein S17
MGSKKSLVGTVISHKMQKTAIVSVQRTVQHPLYQKYLRVQKKYKVHDAKEEAQAGDRVRITECRPVSREKRWRITEIVKRAEL